MIFQPSTGNTFGITNPSESTFSTVRLRTNKTRGCILRTGVLAMVFKLTKTAEQKWRKLKGHERLAQVGSKEAHKVGA